MYVKLSSRIFNSILILILTLGYLPSSAGSASAGNNDYLPKPVTLGPIFNVVRVVHPVAVNINRAMTEPMNFAGCSKDITVGILQGSQVSGLLNQPSDCYKLVVGKPLFQINKLTVAQSGQSEKKIIVINSESHLQNQISNPDLPVRIPNVNFPLATSTLAVLTFWAFNFKQKIARGKIVTSYGFHNFLKLGMLRC